MQITRVELRNIKNHAEAAWTFGPGVVAICGPNGAGKTTILEAIAWALFDHLDYNREDFIRRGAKKGQVTVSFISNADGREYVVTRDTGGSYFVYDPDTKVRLYEQKNQVLPFLKQQIGIAPEVDPATLFKSTIGVPQGTFTYDFTLAPAPRKKVFDQILKVEEYRHASDNLKDTLRHIEGRIAEADRRLAAAEGELKNYDETKERHDETSARLLSLEEELRAAIAERDHAISEAARLSELQQQIAAERGAVERWRIKLDGTRDKLAAAKAAAEAAHRAAEIIAAARAGYENYQHATRSLAELERERSRRDELRARSAQIERELMVARVQVERARERLAEVAGARLTLAGLAAQISEQSKLEERIAQLREARGEAQSIQHSLTTLDRELEKLRSRYSDISRRLEAAEKQRELAERADALEDARLLLDDEIRQKEGSLNNYKVKRELLETLRAELKRLSRERETNSRELARLEPLSDAAARLAAREAQQQRDTEQIARLRAEVARDSEMIASLESGGLCPLLTEKCLNLKPGESLDSRFRTGLEERRAGISRLQTEIAALGAEVKELRTAAAEAARLPKLREEAARLTKEITEREQRLASLENEIAPGRTVSDGEIKELLNRRTALEALLREAREAQKLYSQAEPLRRELSQVKAEGSTRKKDREELSRRLARFGDIEAQLAEAQTRLQALNDPRGRAAALEQFISREPEYQREAETAAAKATEITGQLDQCSAALEEFATLDVRLAEAAALRTASERDYQAFIASEKTAATVAACDSEVAALATELAQTEAALGAAQEQLQQLEAGCSAEAHAQAQARMVQTRDRATQLTTQLEHLRQQFALLQTQLAALNEVRKRMREDLAAKEKAIRLQQTADFIRDILLQAAPYITETWLLSISHEANQFFREITGRYDVTLRWTGEYEITLEEEGRERPFASLSGGEQMAAALAVRLALLRQLSEVNLAFFDEPTTNMDEERRRNLAQQIGRIRAFQQLFVISHDDSFESFTDQVITLEGKSDG
ncbi:MAG TPA: SMC family ATPase [Blastocatellia bacterium]|nr:SMC family ATPase [Blastocatellia bacterium]